MNEIVKDDAISGVIVQPVKTDVEAWNQMLDDEYQALVSNPMRIVTEAFKILDVDPSELTPAETNARTQLSYALLKTAEMVLKIQQHEDRRGK